MEERAPLKENGIQDDASCLREFRGKTSATRTHMFSLKVPTTARWSNGPAAPFKTMRTQFETFGKLEAFDDNSKPDRNRDAKKLGFFGERSSLTLYKQKRKRNSIAMRLLGENTELATDLDMSVSKEQNVAQRLNSKLKSNPIGCTENTENKKKDFNRRKVEISFFH